MYKPKHLAYNARAALNRFRIQVIVLVVVVLMAISAAVALAAIDDQPGAGNPDVNPTQQCPPGQNKDTSVGGLKKCDALPAPGKWW